MSQDVCDLVDVFDGMIRTCQEEYVSAIFNSPDSAWIVIHTLVQLLQKLQLPVGDNLAGLSFLTSESPLADVAPRASSEESAAVKETLREDESLAVGEEPRGFPRIESWYVLALNSIFFCLCATCVSLLQVVLRPYPCNRSKMVSSFCSSLLKGGYLCLSSLLVRDELLKNFLFFLFLSLFCSCILVDRENIFFCIAFYRA